MNNEHMVLNELDMLVEEDEDEDNVYILLARKEKELLYAAEAGQLLIARNEELKNCYERLNSEFAEKIETYETEKCKMKRYFIERESSYQERIHSLSIDKEMLLAKLNAAERISVQRRSISSENLESLTSQNDVLRKELDMATCKNKELSLQVQTLKRRIEGRSMSASYCSEDYLELKMVNEQIRKLRSENKSLGEALEDLATEKLSFMEDAEKSKEKIVVLEQKAKHLEQQIVIAKSELDESKSSNLQLKEQLEDYILQASRMSFTASNSLLNELESSIHEEGDRMFVDSKLDDNDEFTPKFMSSPDRLRNGRVSSLECEREDKESPATDHQYLRNNSSDSSTTECLERQIEELNKKLNESTRSYEQLYKKYTTNVGQLRNAETRIIDMEQQVNYYQRELDVYKKEREIIMNEGSIDTALAISLEDRRKAYKGENEALRQLEQAKSDMVKLNNQLLEAVQQKLELSEQLEMWQVDMAALIEKQLNKTPGKQESKGHRKSRLFTGRWSWSSATKAS